MRKVTWLVCFLLLFSVGCSKAKNKEEERPVAEVVNEAEPKSLSLASVVLNPGTDKQETFDVEVAASTVDRLRGLQGRESLGKKNGMWFVFNADVTDSFWMKDTQISLDIVFVDKDFKIVTIVENTKPNSEELIDPGMLYRYALEINAGTAKQYGLTVGDSVEYRLGPPEEN